MIDRQIIETIDELVAEEHALRQRHGEDPLGTDDAERLRAIEASLDQCWDLLRRRRARREFGDDPDAVQARPIDTVEGYRQ